MAPARLALAVLLALGLSAAVAQVAPSPAPASLEHRSGLIAAWYPILLGRPAGAPELAYWADLLTKYEAQALAANLVRAAEAQGLVYRRIATRALGSASDAAVAAWVANAPKHGQVRSDIRFELMNAPGLVRGKDTPQARVDGIYRLVLGRPATRVEQEGWALAMARGMARAGVMRHLASSDEGLRALCTAVWVEAMQRPPLEPELDHLFALMRQGFCEEDLLAGVLCSPEFQLRHRVPR